MIVSFGISRPADDNQKKAIRFRMAFSLELEDLNESCFLEGDEGAALLHGLESLSRNCYADLLAEFRNEKGLRLKVNLTAALARRIEFGSTNTVRVPASNL